MNKNNNAHLFWITGLSGSGKTTFAKILLSQLESQNQKTILLDGDVMREIFGNSSDYSRESRLKTADQYSKLASFLVSQGINVICSTISLFHEIHDWNRKNVKNYFEIFVDVDMTVLEKRDSKKIYSRAKNGELQNVVGVDLKAEFPTNPDLILKNIPESELEKFAKEAIVKAFRS